MTIRFRTVPSLTLALVLASGLAAGSFPSLAAAPPTSGRSAAASDQAPAPVDINAASAADLETVPGIGHALAQRVVAFREKNGPFGSVDDLLKVQGIGEKSLAKLRPYLTVAKAR